MRSGQTATVEALAAALERRGYNVIPFFGYPNEQALRKFAFDENREPGDRGARRARAQDRGQSRNDRSAAARAERARRQSHHARLARARRSPLTIGLSALIAAALGFTGTQWEASPKGLDIVERSWQVRFAEFRGTGRADRRGDQGEWCRYRHRRRSLPRDAERVVRAADRLAAWAALRATPTHDKRVALIYFNYPPGKEDIGASYLNVLPKSLWTILGRFKADGYAIDGAPASDDALFTAVRERGGNINGWDAGALELRVREGVAQNSVQLLSVKNYREWLERDVRAVPARPDDRQMGRAGKIEDHGLAGRKGQALFRLPGAALRQPAARAAADARLGAGPGEALSRRGASAAPSVPGLLSLAADRRSTPRP